eukprot:6211035-Pleurochrysis_carterae.AAC.1
MSSKHGRDEQAKQEFWFPEAKEGYAVGEVLHHDHDRDNLQVLLKTSSGAKGTVSLLTAPFAIQRLTEPFAPYLRRQCQYFPRTLAAYARRAALYVLQTLNFHASVAKPINPPNLDGVEDNTQLMHLHEPSLLHNLRCRYQKDLIYTYTGVKSAWAAVSGVIKGLVVSVDAQLRGGGRVSDRACRRGRDDGRRCKRYVEREREWALHEHSRLGRRSACICTPCCATASRLHLHDAVARQTPRPTAALRLCSVCFVSMRDAALGSGFGVVPRVHARGTMSVLGSAS